MNDLEYRFAAHEDVGMLSNMNQRLIRDERHRNKMTLPELHDRMSSWLKIEYTAVIFSKESKDIGYALYREDPDWVYLRQFFIEAEMRRNGLGRQAMSWLKQKPWNESKIIRVEVLTANPEGISFWKAVGFKDYCISMEMEN